MKCADALYTDEMDGIDRWMLAAWLNESIRRQGVNEFFPGAILPATGMAVRDEQGATVAVAALYLERSSSIAVCGWCCADPCRCARDNAAAVKLLLASLPIYAKRQGAEYLMSVFGKRSLNRVLDSMGFVNGEAAETKIRRL